MTESNRETDSGAALTCALQAVAQGRIYPDSHARLLIDGPDTCAAMLEAIRSARKRIDLETFIFDESEVGGRFAEALIERCQSGVVVRVLYDWVGSVDTSEAFFQRMRDGGIDVIGFNPVNPLRRGKFPNDPNVRNHRKLLVVDGEIAFTGGVNLTDKYESSSGGGDDSPSLDGGWRDTHVSIQGPAVAGFAEIFEKNWCSQGGARVGRDIVEPEPAGDHRIAVLASEGGNENHTPIFEAYIKAISEARDRVWITQAYFVPNHRFRKCLKQAARRGVDVRVIVPGISDSTLVLNASRARYGGLLRKGVQIFENPTTFIHAKTAVIDGFWSTVGSSNLDSRSFIHNHEVNAVILDRDFARRMEAQFEHDIENCRAITYKQWNNRPFRDKVLEWLSRLVEYWI